MFAGSAWSNCMCARGCYDGYVCVHVRTNLGILACFAGDLTRCIGCTSLKLKSVGCSTLNAWFLASNVRSPV